MFKVFACLTVEHDLRLVLLAGAVCIIGSLTAVDLIRRSRFARGRRRWVWTIAAGAGGGSGIWATHLIATLAYVPGIPISYNIGVTVAALFVAMVATSLGLAVGVRKNKVWSVPIGGAVLGLGVAAMHYLGMTALEIPGRIEWAADLVALSLVIGVSLASAALFVAVADETGRNWIGAALLLTFAIVGLHFTAMAAVTVTPDPTRAVDPITHSPIALGVAIAGVAFAVLGISLMGAFADRRLKGRETEFVAALRNSEERSGEVAEIRFSSTFEQAAVGMAHGGFDGRILRINQCFCDMLGYSRDEILKIPLFELTHPDDRESVKTKIKRIMAGEITHYSDERRYLAKDGRHIPAAVTVSLARGVDGEPDYLVAVMQDISTRKSVEDNLRENEAALRALGDSLPDSAVYRYCVEPDGTKRFLYISAGVEKLNGLTVDEVLADAGALHAQVLPEYFEKLMEAEQASMRELSDLSFEAPMRRADGEVRWMRLRSRPDRQQDGRTIWNGVRSDITDEKRMEAQLALSAAVFKSAHEGVLVADLGGEIVMVNPAFETMTGFDASEMIGQKIGELRSGRHDQAFYRNMWRDIHESGYWQGEIWNRRKSGEIVPDWVTISTVSDAKGVPSNYVAMYTDISQLKETETRLSYLAHHDPLTGLPNRLLLRTRIDQELARVDRKRSKGAVLFLDLDRFKMVNDSFGHAAGDQLLKLAAERLKARLRPSDTLARLGGDEFVVVLADLDNPLAAGEIARGLIDELALPFILAGEREVYVGLSIGISLVPVDGDNADSLIQHADTALLLAKKAGGGDFRFYSKELTSAAATRMKLEADMHRALEQGEFVLQYQPLMSLAQNRMVGVEALVRWRSPNGLIAPLSFIPMAEETGLIVPLGEWVLREACERMQAWRAAGLELDSIAVNLSPVQFRQANLCECVGAILAETGLSPEFLELEITESALMEQGGEAEAKLAGFKALGLRLAIDDFGTGHSSLAYLKRFPIDKLKIDRAFIADIPGDETSMEITAAVIRLAHSLKVKALAEGIEIKAQAEFLVRQGCDMAQGYYFDKPLWEEELIERLGGLQNDRAPERKKA